MNSRIKRFFNLKNLLLSIIILLQGTTLRGQDNSPYYLDNTYDRYIEYLTNSDKIDVLHPLNQPFTALELFNSFGNDSASTQSYWSTLLKTDLLRYLPTSGKNGKLVIGAEAEARFSQKEANFDHNYLGSVFGNYNYQNVQAHFEYQANTEYLDEDTFFEASGKLQNRIFSRASTAFMKYSNSYLNLFYGRLDRNYGALNSNSLIRSQNPFSYDHFSMEIQNELFKYSFSTTRLDDKFGYDSRDSVRVETWNNRFISFHRLEMAFSKKLKIALTESILYGGEDQVFLPAYISPINIFYLAKINDRRGFEEQRANAFGSIEVLAKPFKNFVFFGQFLLDDMDFTKSLRSEFPDRIALSMYASFIDLIPQSQIKVSYDYVSNWTYNSFYTFGNYTFVGRSIGFPKNGFERINLTADIFSWPKLLFTGSIGYQRERAQDLETHFEPMIRDFPAGIEQKTLIGSIALKYLPNVKVSASLNLEFQNSTNYQHILGNNRSFLNAFFSVRFKGIWANKGK